jgi:hypothetical protein
MLKVDLLNAREKRSVELPMMEDMKPAAGFSRDPARENF